MIQFRELKSHFAIGTVSGYGVAVTKRDAHLNVATLLSLCALFCIKYPAS